MQNHAFADVESATVRVRWFSSRPAAEIATEMPILPADAPGLPPIGPSFRRYASKVGDPVEVVDVNTKKRKTTAKFEPGPYLTALVRASLYQDMTPLEVTRPDGPETVTLMPGLFACDQAGGDPYGPQSCRLVVVGKCPGRDEITNRKPFIGPGTQPLWEAWDLASIPRPGRNFPVFLTNLVRFQLTRNELVRVPKEFIADGLHLLHQELAQARPEVLLVLGADALKALFGPRAKVNDFRGRVVPLELDFRPTPESPPDKHVVSVVAADHHNAVSRDPDQQPQLNNSLRLVARTLGFASAPSSVPTDYRAVYTLSELSEAVEQSRSFADGGGYLAFDCEWDGGHPSDPGAYLYTVQWSHGPGHARVVFLRRQGGVLNPHLPIAEAAKLLRKLFVGGAKSGARLVGHFAKADMPWLESIGVDLYDYFVGPPDQPGADGVTIPYGWQETYFKGAFDTYVAAHSTEESEGRKLEILCANRLGSERWDIPVIAWKEAHCKELKISQSQLTGYGAMPEDLITRYGGADADYAGRLYLHYNGDPRQGTTGLLDKDRYGNSSRQIFGVRMRAWAAWADMERVGIEIDVKEHHRLRDIIVTRRDELVAELRAEANWEGGVDADGVERPAFDPGRRRHRVEFLFGENQLDCPSVRPPGALSLYLQPYKATDSSGGRLWGDALWRAEKDNTDPPAPAADKESLVHLARQHHLAGLLRDIDFLGTAMKILFRRPDDIVDENDKDSPTGTVVGDNEVHDKGFIACICGDNRIRSTFGFVETGRCSSSRPNLQNVGSAADSQYDRILVWGEEAKKRYKDQPDHPDTKKKFVSRSIMRAKAGHYIVGADLKGAEIAAAAWASGDPVLIEHAYCNTLPESHPDYLDLHSDLARTAFGLTCSLAEVKKNYKPLRVAAKRVRFGHYYGASPDTILRQVLEDTTEVTIEQIVAMVAAHDKTYPTLAQFFASCRARVTSPGWLCNGAGGMRRFRRAADRDLIAGQEREAQNWSCQGAVADIANTALGHLWYELRARQMRSRIILSVHDSFMLECPPQEVPAVVDEILPLCITEKSPFVPSTLDGYPINRGPYHFGIDVEVCRSWGIDVPEAEWREHAKAAQ